MAESAIKDDSEDAHPYSCDLVMKGGITSGVVYPGAIVELARDHRFHRIAGSSAGAIAAAITVAAEYGRQTTNPGAFDELDRIPAELAEDAHGATLLQRLFVPQPGTDEYFHHFFEQKALEAGAMKRFAKLRPSLWRHSRLLPESGVAIAATLVLPIVGLLWLALQPSAATAAFSALAVVAGGAVYTASRTVAGVKGMVRDSQQQLSDNMHGLVNGSSVGDQVGLTQWMHDKIEQVAGSHRWLGDGPLTYGDLAAADLQMVTLTTNLSQGSSDNFPFADETWAFRISDIEELFPSAVATLLRQRGAKATKESSKREQLEELGLLKLPPAQELPVLMGARVSLSFPILFSAVPLWRLVPVRTSTGWTMQYRKVWLSDGGICSNMPVHLFDRPLPSRPTYGISLASGATEELSNEHDPDGMKYGHRNVWRPIRTGAGANTPIGKIDTTTDLLGEVLNTMQNWSDSSATRALGVRDRICTIRLRPGEGGMNLDMGSETILGLRPRGKAAGEDLGWMVRGQAPENIDQVDLDQLDEAETQWARHRWSRLRSVVASLDDFRNEVEFGWNDSDGVPQAGPRSSAVTYPDLAAQAHEALYLPYRSKWNAAAGKDLHDAVEAYINVDFGSANKVSPPPRRPLRLSTRDEPTVVASPTAGVSDLASERTP